MSGDVAGRGSCRTWCWLNWMRTPIATLTGRSRLVEGSYVHALVGEVAADHADIKIGREARRVERAGLALDTEPDGRTAS